MKRCLLIAFAVLTFGGAAAATDSHSVVTVVGTVLSQADSVTLNGAVISVNGGQVHTLTGHNGRFTITQLPKGKEVRLDLSTTGFEPLAVSFTPDTSPFSVDTLFMTPITSEIDAIVISASPPMAVQLGDTTQFNAAAFKTNPDADADELIAKMPGVVIQEGKIEAQGEPIYRVYVDGKLFFKSDPMAALKNIPADAVQSVQIFDELSEQARFAGIEDGETRKSINIITKSKSKRNDMARFEASAGRDLNDLDQTRYLVGGRYTHMEDKSRVTVTGIANNVSKANFTQDDMNSVGKIDSNGNPRNQRQGLQTIYGLGADYSLDTKKLVFSGSYFYDYSDVDLQRYTVKTFFPTVNAKGVTINRVNDITDLQRYMRNNHRLDFRAEVHLSEKDVVVISPSASYSDLNYPAAYKYTYIFQNGDSTRRTLGNNPQNNIQYSLSGTALYTHRFEKKGRSFSANLTYNIGGGSPYKYTIDGFKESYTAKTGTWAPLKSDTLFNYLQDQNANSNSLRFRISYSEPITLNHRVNINAIGMKEWGMNDTRFRLFDDQTQGYDSTSTAVRFNPKALNTYSYAGGGGLGYSYVASGITFAADFNYQRIFRTLNVTEPYQNVTRTQIDDFQPSVSLRYSLAKKRYMRLSYSGRTKMPDISRMQDYVDRTNANTWYEGNPNLSPGYTHSMTLYYNSSNQQRNTFFTMTLRAAAVSNYTTTATYFPGLDYTFSDGTPINPADTSVTIVKWINLDGYYSAGISATYSMALKPIKSNLNLSLDYQYSRVPSMFRVLNYGNNHAVNVRVGLTSNISQNVDFNLYSSTYANYTANSALADTRFINENLSYSFNLIFWKGFVFNTLITWKHYYTSSKDGLPDDQLLIDTGLGKKFFKRQNGELRLTVFDILDQSRTLLHYVQNNSIDEVETNTLGRYAILKFTYRFNSMSSNKPRKSSLPKSAVSTAPATKGSGIKRIDGSKVKLPD